MDQQEDVSCSKKDDDKKVAPPDAVNAKPDEGSSDAVDVTKDHNLISNDPKTVEEPKPACDIIGESPKPLPKTSSLDKSKVGNPDKCDKLSDETDLLIPPESVASDEHDEAIKNVNIGTEEKLLSEVVKPSFEISKSKPSEANVKDINKLINNESGYKETVIDNTSDTDLVLRWSDDDDSHFESLSEEELKKLDKELGLTGDETVKSAEKSTNLDQDVIGDTAEIVKKQTEINENNKQTKLIDNISVDNIKNATEVQLLDDNMLKKLDEELGIADIIKTKYLIDQNKVVEDTEVIRDIVDSENTNFKSIDTTVEHDEGLNETVAELQQLIDSNNAVEESITTKEHMPTENNSKATDNTKSDIIPMEVSDAIEDQVKPVDDLSEIDKISKKVNIDIDPIKVADQIKPLENNSVIDKIRDNDNESMVKLDSSENIAHAAVDASMEIDISQQYDEPINVSEGDDEHTKLQPAETMKVSEKDLKIESMNIDLPPETENTVSCVTSIVIKAQKIEDLNKEENDDDTVAENVAVNNVSNSTKVIDDKIEDIKVNTDIVEEFITPDSINDSSIRVNTEHRINRPDVMLDIPTQEFDFDEFNETSDNMTENSVVSEKINMDCSNMIEKTVTEIVNQLAKDDQKENSSKIAETTEISDADLIQELSTKNANKHQSENTDEKVIEKDSSINIISADKNKEQQEKNVDEIGLETVQKADEKCTENVDGQEVENNKVIILEKDLVPVRNKTEVRVKNVEEINRLSSAASTEDINDKQDKYSKDTLKSDVELTEVPKEYVKEGSDTKAKDKAASDTVSTTGKVQEQEDKNKEPQLSEKDTNTAEISTENKKEPEVDKEKDTQNEKDPKNTEKSTEKSSINKMDAEPSTSADTKNTDSDNSDDTQEVMQDSLGLLAESFRVIDDDDQEQEEDEVDDVEGEDDDDDDFDPDDEGSSNQHSEESNPANSEIDIKDEGIDIVENINMADSNDANDGFMADELGTTDITIEDNEPVPLDPKVTEIIEENIDSEPKEKSAEPKKPGTERRKSILAELLTKANNAETTTPSDSKKLPDKSKDQVKSLSGNIVNIVDLEESSSEDDIQVNKEAKEGAPSSITETKQDKDKDSVAKSVTDKCTEESDKAGKDSKKDETDASKMGEIFNLDSDEDDKSDSKDIEDTSKPRNTQCINHNCTSDYTVPYYLADRVTIAYYGAASRRKRAVCQSCLNIVISRNHGLLKGIKDLRPLMSLRMSRPTQQLLEISDSDSEGDDDPIGEDGAKILEDQLASLLNETWSKYKMDARLKETEDYLLDELEKMDKQSKEIDELLKDCQKATDTLRVEFYSGFEPTRQELPSLILHDTPVASYACLETEEIREEQHPMNLRYPKRRSSSAIDTPAKKQAFNAAFADEKNEMNSRHALGSKDEDMDISVVRLSAESAPSDLPPTGELTRPPLKAGAHVYAMKNPYGAWLRGRLIEILPKASDQQFSQCRVRFEHKQKNLLSKVVAGRCIAYTEPCPVRMTIGTRVIALFKNSDNTTKRQSFYYSGIVAEIPNPVNNYRYLVFFDDGYVQYVQHCDVRLVYESSPLVWEEVHPYSRDFVSNYLMKYPERPMVRMHTGQSLVVEYNGKWLETKVVAVDAALVKVQFSDMRTEWIYRGSTRLQPLFAEFQAARRGDRARLPRSTKQISKTNMPYVEYTRSEEQARNNEAQAQSQIEELRRQRAVAKKSTVAMPQASSPTPEHISRVVFYTPKNSVRPYKMIPHTCGPQCRRTDLLSLKELRTYNPLTKPLLSGWERQIIRHKYSRCVMYRAPCGRRVRDMRELHAYLRAVRSDMPVDLFDFSTNTHCLAEFVLNKTNVQKKDLSHGKENVPVPCVNYYDSSLPEFCSYNTERTPTAGVPLNLDPDFLCGCDCDDDCADKTKCACWKMTLEGARTIGMEGNVGYEYRRLPEPLPSGIYECNSRCKCKSTCLNRVVQNPLQLKLQVFKTINRGWGIRALNDVPKGSFLCIYAGNLLTDATANLDGLNEGDEYLAELDYIEVVESMKEGYEEDIPELDKKLDKKETGKKVESEPESESSESEEEEKNDRNDQEDDDFHPTPYFGMGLTEFSKRLRRRDKNKNKEEEQKKEEKEQEQAKTEDGDDCITISDDEEVRVSTREPARFTAQEGMTDNKVVPKYRSIRTYFGRDEACYIMDAKVQGNIGRYLNHSCSPNVFVQNVFVDTHDPRFPWVSFFALHHIRAGTELTWNYNYDIGSVPGKVLYCFCGAPNCRGRLL